MNLNLDTKIGAELFILLLRGMKSVCEKYEACCDCPFRSVGKCLMHSKPEDYDIQLISKAIYEQLNKEQAEEIVRSLRKDDDNGNR